MRRVAESLFRDVRYGVRQLLRAPLFAAAAVVTLALAIGANSALFAAVNAVVLRPLAYPDSERIVSITVAVKGDDIDRMDEPTTTVVMASGAQAFDALAAYDSMGGNLTGGAEPERVSGARVSEGYFKVFGVQPAIGRAFHADDVRADSVGVVILSHGLWTRNLGGARDVVGRTIRLDDRSLTVVGVMPQDFSDPARSQFWLPRVPRSLAGGGLYYTDFAGRLRPGASIGAAQQELTALRAAHLQELPKEVADTEIRMMTLHERLRGSLRGSLLLLWGIAACVLLIASANIANLLLARSASRRRELALRIAIGASRGRLVRQLLAESVLLAAVGAVPGLALAEAGLRGFQAFGPAQVTSVGGIAINGDVLWFTVAVTLATGVLFGVAPAVSAGHVDPHEGLKVSRASGFRRSGGRPRRVLVVLELAAAVVLTIGAALLVKSFVKYHGVNRGFEGDAVLTASLSLPRTRYATEPARRAFFDGVLERLQASPAVESMSFSQVGVSGMSLTMSWPPGADRSLRRTIAMLSNIGPRHFQTYGIPIQTGRECAANAPGPEAVINTGLARFAFADRNAIGERLDLGPQWALTVVGVSSDVRQLNSKAAPLPTVYACASRAEAPAGGVIAVRARAGVDPLSLAPAIRDAVRMTDPEQPITTLAPLSQTVGRAMTSRWFDAGLVTLFAGVALVLAVLGLYAVIAYGVAERTHEIGVRMALGASRRDVLGLVLRQGSVLTAAGLAMGLVAAVPLSSLVRSMLFDVAARDVSVFVATTGVMVAVSLTASLIPAIRASRVDPLVSLRHE